MGRASASQQLNGPGSQMTTTQARALIDAEARTLDSYWRAANYLSVGQIYLLDNPLLTEGPDSGPSHRGP
jgi:phosphoketolase